jgi:hypothetical protein
MDEQQPIERSKAGVVWWATAAILLTAVAGLVWGWNYAQRREAALERLNNVKLRAPGFVPESLRSRLPAWACDVVEISGTRRDQWATLATLTEVETLISWDADLTDDDLKLLAQLRRLKSLEFMQERVLSDAGLVHLAESPRLTTLVFSQVDISDASFSTIARLPRLERLYIHQSRVTGSGLPELKQAKHLRFLDLGIETAPATGLDALGQLEALEELQLAGMGVRNESLRQLALPLTLRSLDLSRAEVSDTQDADLVEVLTAVRGIERVTFLDLGGNVMSAATRERLGERLGMYQHAPGVFKKLPSAE